MIVTRAEHTPTGPKVGTFTAARFLGYGIRAQHADTKITRNRRAVNGAIGLFVPRDVIRSKCADYMKRGRV